MRATALTAGNAHFMAGVFAVNLLGYMTFVVVISRKRIFAPASP